MCWRAPQPSWLGAFRRAAQSGLKSRWIAVALQGPGRARGVARGVKFAELTGQPLNFCFSDDRKSRAEIGDFGPSHIGARHKGLSWVPKEIVRADFLFPARHRPRRSLRFQSSGGGKSSAPWFCSRVAADSSRQKRTTTKILKPGLFSAKFLSEVRADMRACTRRDRPCGRHTE